MVKIYSRYKPNVVSGITFTDESLTHQEFLEETKTENIINKYIRIGANPYIPADVGNFLDCTSVSDFQTNMDKFVSVTEYFDSLPSDVRLKFNNDPRYFAQFASNPDNKSALEELGLISPDKELKDINPTPPAETEANADLTPEPQAVKSSDAV